MKKLDFGAIIFDLDGTLLDTLDDLARAANRVLASRGFPGHPPNAYRWFVGDGSKLLITRALPTEQRNRQQIDGCLKDFIADYGRHWNLATRPYDGIPELIDNLAAKNIPMAVVTNKPHQFTDMMMNHYFSGKPFDPVVGQRDGIPKKPDPHAALAAAKMMGIPAAQCIFLGDSAVDMETAQRAGMRAVGASWGFRPRQELIESGATVVIDHPLELLDLF